MLSRRQGTHTGSLHGELPQMETGTSSSACSQQNRVLQKGMRVAPNGETKRAPELSDASLFVSLSMPGRIGLA